MGDITREPGLNSGLPAHGKGLDPETKANLLAAANKTGEGVIVGGIQDVQRFFGELAKDGNEPTVGLPPGETEDSPTSLEHDELVAATTGTPHGNQGGGKFDDSFTVEELKDAARDRGVETSGNKQELIDRLNG